MLNERVRVKNDLLRNDHHVNTTIMYHNLEEDDEDLYLEEIINKKY